MVFLREARHRCPNITFEKVEKKIRLDFQPDRFISAQFASELGSFKEEGYFVFGTWPPLEVTFVFGTCPPLDVAFVFGTCPPFDVAFGFSVPMDVDFRVIKYLY